MVRWGKLFSHARLQGCLFSDKNHLRLSLMDKIYSEKCITAGSLKWILGQFTHTRWTIYLDNLPYSSTEVLGGSRNRGLPEIMGSTLNTHKGRWFWQACACASGAFSQSCGLSQQNSKFFARNLQLSIKTFSFPAINLKLFSAKLQFTQPASRPQWWNHIGQFTHMLHVWYIYLHDWVILFGQMLVNIPAPWTLWVIGHRWKNPSGWKCFGHSRIAEFTHIHTLYRRWAVLVSLWGRWWVWKIWKGIGEAIFFGGKWGFKSKKLEVFALNFQDNPSWRWDVGLLSSILWSHLCVNPLDHGFWGVFSIRGMGVLGKRIRNQTWRTNNAFMFFFFLKVNLNVSFMFFWTGWWQIILSQSYVWRRLAKNGMTQTSPNPLWLTKLNPIVVSIPNWGLMKKLYISLYIHLFGMTKKWHIFHVFFFLTREKFLA